MIRRWRRGENLKPRPATGAANCTQYKCPVYYSGPYGSYGLVWGWEHGLWRADIDGGYLGYPFNPRECCYTLGSIHNYRTLGNGRGIYGYSHWFNVMTTRPYS